MRRQLQILILAHANKKDLPGLDHPSTKTLKRRHMLKKGVKAMQQQINPAKQTKTTRLAYVRIMVTYDLILSIRRGISRISVTQKAFYKVFISIFILVLHLQYSVLVSCGFTNVVFLLLLLLLHL